MQAEYAQRLRRHSLEVAKLEGGQADEFLRLLRDLQDTLRGRYAALSGQEKEIDVSRLRQIIAETEAGIRVLEVKAGKSFVGAQEDAADLSIDHIVDEVTSLSKAFDGHVIDVSIEATKVLADPMQGLLANHFDSSVKRYGLDLLNDVRRRLFVGLRAGDSVRDVAAGIAGQQGAFGVVGKANAQRLVRTEVSQAYGAAHHAALKETAKQVPGLKKIWLHVGSYLCKVCGPLHGTERDIDGTWTIKSGRKTREVAHPPGHPSCACRLSSMKPSWRAKLQKAGYLGEQPTTDEAGTARL